MPLAVITGANSGIGRATALELGRRGFDLVLLGRTEQRTAPVVAELRTLGSEARFLECDLASLRSVAAAARQIEGPVGVLINNAGVGGRSGLTEDGFELSFGVNHVGHFLLTALLIDRIDDRVVTVASNAHHGATGIDWTAVRRKSGLVGSWRAYQVSKLANVLFSRELARRVDHDRIHTYAVHPGMVSTRIWRLPRPVREVVFRNLLSPEEGAETSVWCATDDAIGSDTGGYYSHCRPARVSDVAADDVLAVELWERTEDWVELYL